MAIDKAKDWVGFDLDGTLATYEKGDYTTKGPFVFGSPIEPMVARVKSLIDRGITCKIVTARFQNPVTKFMGQFFLDVHALKHNRRLQKEIALWTLKHIGTELEVTNAKDGYMHFMVDDRGVSCETGTGKILGACDRWNELFPPDDSQDKNEWRNAVMTLVERIADHAADRSIDRDPSHTLAIWDLKGELIGLLMKGNP